MRNDSILQQYYYKHFPELNTAGNLVSYDPGGTVNPCPEGYVKDGHGGCMPVYRMERVPQAVESTSRVYRDPLSGRQVSTANPGMSQQQMDATHRTMGMMKRHEKNEEQRRVSNRKSARRVMDDETGKATFTLPTGEQKNWGDMNFRERAYVAGQSVSGRFRLNKNKEAWYDTWINPFNWIGTAAGALGTAPYEAKQTNSVLPYVTSIGNSLLMGRMLGSGSINPLGKKFWTNEVSNSQFANNLGFGLPKLIESGYNFANEAVRGSLISGRLKLPEYATLLRVEPAGFNPAEVSASPGLNPTQQGYTGAWIQNASRKNTGAFDEMAAYVTGQETKQPGNLQLLSTRIPWSQAQRMAGKNLPVDAKLMSFGAGKYGTLENALANKAISRRQYIMLKNYNQQSSRIANSPNLKKVMDETISTMRANVDLYNPNEIVNPELTSSMRLAPAAVGAPELIAAEILGLKAQAPMTNYVTPVVDAAGQSAKNILAVPTQEGISDTPRTRNNTNFYNLEKEEGGLIIDDEHEKYLKTFNDMRKNPSLNEIMRRMSDVKEETKPDLRLPKNKKKVNNFDGELRYFKGGNDTDIYGFGLQGQIPVNPRIGFNAGINGAYISNPSYSGFTQPNLNLGMTYRFDNGGTTNPPNDDIEKYKQFLVGFANSPMGRQMLSASVNADDPTGINSSYADKLRIIRNRLTNQADVKALNYIELANAQNQGSGEKRAASKNLQGFNQSPMGEKTSRVSFLWNMLKNPGTIPTLVTSGKHNLYTDSAIQPRARLNKTFIRNDYSDDPLLNKWSAAKTGVHELSHASDHAGVYIPKSDINKMRTYANRMGWSPEFGWGHPLARQLDGYPKYVAEPTETRARLASFRYLAKELGLYNPFTQKATLDTLKNYKSPFESSNDPITQLREVYTDEQIVDLLNSVSKTENKKRKKDDMTVGKYGGKIPPKNGGSTYSAGVWYMDGGDIPNYMQDPNPMYNFGGYFPQAPRFSYGGQTMDNTMMGMINVFEQGGIVEGQVMDVTPDMLQKLKAGGYSFEIIND